MMSKKMAKAINDQINAEFYSAFLYLSMAAYFEDETLPGFANWMRVQAREEEFHAMKFFDHMVERGQRVRLKEIAEPPTEWKSPLDAFEAAYKHEVKVTGMIDDLVKIARDGNDNASYQFLQWFVEEQVEEEDNTSTIRDQIKMVHKMPGGLFMMDKELSQRAWVEPATQGEGA